MKKIPTIFVRDMSKQPALVVDRWNDGCEWVRDGEGRATRKWDGTCCMVRAGKLYKRRELRRGDMPPSDFEAEGTDAETGKTVGWVPVGNGPDDQYHREASNVPYPDGTYELVGPKIQGNKDDWKSHVLVPHGDMDREPAPRDFAGLKAYFQEPGNMIEGLVWHHPDGRMAKIKRRDFGLKW